MTKALGEDVERKLTFNLHEVVKNNLLELPVISTPKNKGEHYTIIEITDVTINAPQRKSFNKIKEELASIYRQFLRSGELCLSFCGENVVFKESEILNAPFVNTPESGPIHWRKDFDFRFGKYHAKGFIGLLKTMSSTQNRIVLLRRGRVILGADTDGHYYSKHISGQSGSPRDKRIFGEIELEGFDVTFNKNGLRDKENLEALFKALVSEIRNRDFDLIIQAQNYRDDELRKAVNKLVKKHDSHSRNDKQPIKIASRHLAPKPNNTRPKDETILNAYEDSYLIDGEMYKLKVTFVQDTRIPDLFWLDISKCDVLSIDIADIDIGKNIGAALQIDQAQADKNIAQAKAEERRAMAIALEQEMRAKAQEARAKVIEAEAELPRAMAQAFINGNLGIMDYYKMKNIESDTNMRQNIANPK